MSAAGLWYCHCCNDTHRTDERAAAHVGTARAQHGGASVEVTAYGCDQYSRWVFDDALTSLAATLARKLAVAAEVA